MPRCLHRPLQCALAKHRSVRAAKLRADATTTADRRYSPPSTRSRSFHHFRNDKKAVCLAWRVCQCLRRCEPVARRILAEHVENRQRVRGGVNASDIRLSKFFDVLQYVIELFLKSFRLVFCEIDPRQSCDVRNIEIRSSDHVRRSGMQMADE